MTNTVTVIGIDPTELAWIRMLTVLLRHPDPIVPELTRQALRYLEAAAARSGNPGTGNPGTNTAFTVFPAGNARQ